MSSAQEQFKKARRRMLKQATKQPITATCSTSCRRLGFVWFGLTLPMITLANDIVTDGTLGGGLHTLPGGHGTIPQNWGTAAGPNLFHSFSDFNIDTGKTATFTENVPNTFDNVITRITGNNPSAINGTLQSTMGHAAFYFINPNGITFGPNAQVDVPGALHLTTADKLNFQNNGGSFYANAQQLSQMSNELPAGVGFLGTSVQNNGLISFNGSQIALQPNQTLDVVGGEITVDNNAKLTTSAGDIRLVAIQNAGTVDIQMNANGALPLPPKMPNESNSGNITLTGSILNADGNGGGNLGVWGNQIIIREDSSASADNLGYLSLVNNSLNIKSASLLIDNSTLSSSAYSTGNAGNVTVQARTVGIVNQGFLSSDTWSSGKAGQVSVTADQLSIDGKAATYATGIFSNAEEGSGHAGEITVQAGTLNIVNQGQIASSTWSSGNAGQVSVTADQLTINSQGARYATGIFSHAEAGSGHAGEIAVQAGRLNIVNQGQIASSTWSSGNAGRVSVIADQLAIDPQGGSNATGILSNAQPNSSGDAGDIAVHADKLDIVNGGIISNSTSSSGNPGQVSVTAERLSIDSQDSSLATGIFSSVYAGSGHDGNITVQAGTLQIVNQGNISSSTWSFGNAGLVSVTTDHLIIDGQGAAHPAGIFSATAGSGQAGESRIKAGTMEIVNGGQITNDTWSSGNAGLLTVTADQLTIDGQDATYPTGILSNANPGSSGDAGNEITIQAGTLNIINQGQISSSTGSSGNAGQVSVTADHLTIDGQNATHGTGIFSSANLGSRGDAGDITVQAGTLDITNIGTLSSSTWSSGHAGQVMLVTDRLNLDSSVISSGSFSADSSGQVGHVNVTAHDSLTMSNGAVISVQNNAVVSDQQMTIIQPGNISVTAGNLFLNNSAITSQSFGNVAAGDINIRPGNHLNLEDASFINTQAQSGNGGNIVIEKGRYIQLNNSGFKTSVEGENSNGGNITVNSAQLVMETGVIQANAVGGNGGNVAINVNTLLPSNDSLIQGGPSISWEPNITGLNIIQAASETGLSGTLNVTTPQLNLSGILANIGVALFDTSVINQDYCGLSQGSTLTRQGLGGLPGKSSELWRF